MRQFFRFTDVLKLMRRKSSTNDVIKVCPICLRKDLEILPNPNLGLIAPRTYFCHFCNYTGPIFAEVEISDYIKIDFENFDYTFDDSSFEGQNDGV
ncbi:MAG: hypothetical protein ACFFAU_04920 [Candidatus Hodarchaeota archaeon]